MGRIDASWRSDYLASTTSAGTGESAGSGEACVFCRLLASEEPDAVTHIVKRAGPVMAILNAYPYTSGHLMCMPTRHVGTLDGLTDDEYTALWSLTRDATVACTRAYQPEGLNVGANLGRAAGAGIPGHLHVHIVPRWNGDTNFMTSIAEVRVVPEALDRTWQKLTDAWPTAANER
jgi:diadenosine tetraphosphate (Ap4A) HIT family hydrolase